MTGAYQELDSEEYAQLLEQRSESRALKSSKKIDRLRQTLKQDSESSQPQTFEKDKSVRDDSMIESELQKIY
jgi:hypothetical protein